MIFAIIAIVALAIALVVAFSIGLKSSSKAEKEAEIPAILNSGIYSVVRRSPKESIHRHKPSAEQIVEHLASQSTDAAGTVLSDELRNRIAGRFDVHLKESIAEIESGDQAGVEFYYYDYAQDDEICAPFVSQGKFVTREELHKFPVIIPPLHLGCKARLCRYHGSENLRKTTELNMLPLFHSDVPPPLPDWKQILAQ